VRAFSSAPSAKVNDRKGKPFKTRNFKLGDTPPNPFSSSKDSEVPQVLSLVENLVRSAANPPPGWKESRSTQTEDYRLHGLVKRAEKARSVSLEQQQFMNNAELSVDEDQGDVNIDFESGSLVEMRRYVVHVSSETCSCYLQEVEQLHTVSFSAIPTGKDVQSSPR
jgi:hypothetical protein